MTIDLNADVGEGFGAYPLGNDEALLALVSSANIACGFHAGDPQVMERTIALAVKGGAALGAHPSYPDLQGFGRRSMALSEKEVYAFVLYQIGALSAFARAAGAELRHVKPHGALYNDAAKDPARARGIARAVKAAGGGLCLVGLPNSEMEKAAAAEGIPYASEFFADRAYEDDGTLVARSKPGAVIHDEGFCVDRALCMVEGGNVTSINGIVIPIRADTICLHGDNPEAVAFASRLLKELKSRGIDIAPPSPAVRG
jgi:5-oxoprolinase (ATP-hydrolysing) subunit A